MFDDKKKLKELRRNISSLQGQRAALLMVAAGERDENRQQTLVRELRRQTRTLETLESSLLREKAHRLGIDVPSHTDKPEWWLDDIEENELQGAPEYAITRWLSPVGKAVIRRRIREEKRKDKEWWLKVILSVLTALTGVGGVVIGIISLLKHH